MSSERLTKRMESMRYCLETAKYLDDSPQHLVPVSSNATVGEIEDAKDKARLSRKHISHMLNAIIFEITIKVLWELDNHTECSYTHKIRALYGELSEKSRREVKEIYDTKSAELAKLEGTRKNKERIMVGDLVEFQSLEDALIGNEDTMKNFKYDGVFNGKSSAMGSIIWNEHLLYVMPSLDHMRLPETLYHYTMSRVEKA